MLLWLVLFPVASTTSFQWVFEGRFAVAPALVPASSFPLQVSAFGWTLGGVVALEYDSSPCGSYVEVVEMGSLCAKNGAIGQWGSDLFVSTERAAKACRKIWKVPAQKARLVFEEEGKMGIKRRNDGGFEISGWKNTRTGGSWRSPGLPVLWTPQIKALWFPLRAPLVQNTSPKQYNLHRLRLSAESLTFSRFSRCDQDEIIPLGFAVSADGLRIEIAEQHDFL